MANTLRISITAGLVHPAGSVSLKATDSRELSGSGFINHEQEVGTSWEAIVLTDIGTLGFLFVRNEDETNFVQIATANDGSQILAKVVAGRGQAIEPQPGATYYIKADTAPVKVLVLATEA